MALSLDQQLANIEAAIEKAENAQDYGVGARRVTYAELQTLYKRRDQIQDRIDRASGGMFTVISIDRPT